MTQCKEFCFEDRQTLAWFQTEVQIKKKFEFVSKWKKNDLKIFWKMWEVMGWSELRKQVSFEKKAKGLFWD